MKVVTPGQMREIDSYATKAIGIPGVVLMENAALKVIDEIIKEHDDVKDMCIYVFAGKGNNGGDTLQWQGIFITRCKGDCFCTQ